MPSGLGLQAVYSMSNFVEVTWFSWLLWASNLAKLHYNDRTGTILIITLTVPHNGLLFFHYPIGHFEPLLFYTFLPIAMLNPKIIY